MKFIYPLGFCLLFSLVSYGQKIDHDNETQIKNLIIESFDEIWSELESKNISKFYTDDFLLIENGEVWNNDSIANYLNNARLANPIPKRVNRFDFIEIKIIDGIAWLAYHNFATFTINNEITREAHWLESANAIKTKNGWKVQMLHSSKIK